MKKTISAVFIVFMLFSLNAESWAKSKDIKIKNKFFSITLPKELKSFYSAKVQKEKITIYHKPSKKAGFGGLVFGVGIYKNPSSHAMMPGGQKIGELADKKGEIYDMVLYQPTDVQYDYTKKEPDSYKLLYNLAKTADIQGINGATYYKNQGMKGENLYKDILRKHITAIKEKWDSSKLEAENMSYMYNVIASNNDNPLDKVGYAYYDVNGDGIDELFIGEIAKGTFKGVAYDIYTMKDRSPIHVVSGGARDRYYACDSSFICNEYSGGANEYGVFVYNLVENSSELFPQVGFKYDGYENSKNPWFITYNIPKDKWDNVSKETFMERKRVFEDYVRFDYTALRKAL